MSAGEDRSALNPHNVGILAMEVYTPRTYCRQADLEQHMGVAAGKFVIGLGQEGIAVTGDAEDINSICLTAVHSLLENYEIEPSSVGRLEVGTETLIDKSKSTKTVLMDLFPGVTDMEGATCVNACYGGTAALWNAIHWCQCNEKYAIVVAADIATYASGPARPTCGVGAVAMLIGRDAPLVPQHRATHASHTWDFYKPNPSTEYPVVDGALSQVCYYEALHDVYGRLASKIEQGQEGPFTVESPDYWVFHAPYNKLVQKSFGRLFLHDAKRQSDATSDEKRTGEVNSLQEWIQKPMEETYDDKMLEKALKSVSKDALDKRVSDSNAASKIVGNTYTASVFLGMASLIDRQTLSTGQMLAVFSYGSGALATMYTMRVRDCSQDRFSIQRMKQCMNLTSRLSTREVIGAAELDLALNTRARMHHQGAPYTTSYPSNRLFPGTYYLVELDDKWRRTYARRPLDSKPATGGSLAPASVIALDQASEQRVKTNSIATTCLITGISAGLPGSDHPFDGDNISRLLKGSQCIRPLKEETKQAMLAKNIVQQKKLPDKTQKAIPCDKAEHMIQVSSTLGSFSLTDSYGVPQSLAKTMDVAAQVAVAAGMEAMKDAGLVTGGSSDPSAWKVPDDLRDTTGIVYASSFPAMDAAVGEVMRYLNSRDVTKADAVRLVSALRQRLLNLSSNGALSDEDEEAFARLLTSAKNDSESSEYYFDRKFLFRVLVLGNAQLAQLTGCRGPNTQVNAACAGTTQAIAIAQDMLTVGRAERVVVIAGDNASGDVLMPWLGSGFRVLGAATTKGLVEEAAVPFDQRRSGMIMGAGGVGLVIETPESAAKRSLVNPLSIKARLLATQYSNSAYHGAALDRDHISSELDRFLVAVEEEHGITREEICTKGVYFSHETCTHNSVETSCAGNEIAALRKSFGPDLLKHMLILNTKGFTGHPMGVSFEDVAAVAVLMHQKVPPIVNHKVVDDYLGDIQLSNGGDYECTYALRFAAGFGSQVAFTLYATTK